MGGNKARGLTLVEMMVVMLIASLALTLGYQSLLQWQRAQASVAGAGSAVLETTLAESWWRESVRGISARRDLPLEGDSSGFRATSAREVLSAGGVDAEQHWSAERQGDTWVLAMEGSGAEVRLPLRDVQEVRFQYLDASGTWHDRWPPDLGIQDKRPLAVALNRKNTDGSESHWIASPQADTQPHFPLFEIEEY